jgi:hypothetical protein
MKGPLRAILTADHFLACLKDVEEKHDIILDLFGNSAVNLWAGSVMALSASYNHFVAEALPPDGISPIYTDPLVASGQWEIFLANIKKNPPDFVLVETIYPPAQVEHTEIYAFLKQHREELGEDLEKYQEILMHQFDIMHGVSISFRVLAIYSGVSVCLSYTYWSPLLMMLGEHDLTQADVDAEPDEDTAIDDDWNDEPSEEEEAEYQREQEAAMALIEQYARELSLEPRLALTRNADQRIAVAKEFFGDRYAGKEYSLDGIARRAMDIFEIDVLPGLVRSLKESGKSAKAISEELGISLAKAKKIFSIV